MLLAAIDAIPGFKDEVHVLQDKFELPSDEASADPME
jgi:hypothetical protein